jgi:hypothetical protein
MKRGTDFKLSLVRAQMALLGWNTADLAAATGYRRGYVSNVINGTATSRRARERITAALGTVIWEGVEVPANNKPSPEK